jgi:hypothetical protein
MKTVPIALRVWAKREKSGDVTIKVAGPFISTIRDTPGSKRYHKPLYNHLKKILLANHVWPA